MSALPSGPVSDTATGLQEPPANELLDPQTEALSLGMAFANGGAATEARRLPHVKELFIAGRLSHYCVLRRQERDFEKLEHKEESSLRRLRAADALAGLGRSN